MSEELQTIRKANKRALGRGLGSLLGEIGEEALPAGTPISESSAQKIWKISIEKVIPNANQPRKHFDQTKLLN